MILCLNFGKLFILKLIFLSLPWCVLFDSEITKKKYLKTMQSLRDLKFKDYPFWRFDKKDLQIIKGGWHFSFLQTPDQILEKIKSFSHGEFNSEEIDKRKIEAKISDNIDIFNRGNVLKKINLDETFPPFILENKNKFSEWII